MCTNEYLKKSYILFWNGWRARPRNGPLAKITKGKMLSFLFETGRFNLGKLEASKYSAELGFKEYETTFLGSKYWLIGNFLILWISMNGGWTGLRGLEVGVELSWFRNGIVNRIISQIWATQRNTIYLPNSLYQLQIAKTLILSLPTMKLALYKSSLACGTFILLHRSNYVLFLSLV